MKGGVGKTALAGNMFREIFRGNKISTLLVDFDPQFNLSQMLLASAQYDMLKLAGKTLLQVMEPSPSASAYVTSKQDLLEVDPIENYTHRIRRMQHDENIVLDIILGDFGIAKFNLQEKSESLKVPRERFKRLIAKARERYKLVVIDCNPSSSFLTRTAVEVASHILVPVKPDKYSMRGVEMLYDYVHNFLPSVTTKPEFMFVLNGVPRSRYDKTVENELRGNRVYGPLTLVNPVYETEMLAARPDYTGFAADRKVPPVHLKRITKNLREVAGETAKRLGLA